MEEGWRSNGVGGRCVGDSMRLPWRSWVSEGESDGVRSFFGGGGDDEF